MVLYCWTFWGFLDTKFMWLLFYDYDLMLCLFDLPKQLIIVFLCSHVTNTTLVGKSRQILLRISCTYRAFLSVLFCFLGGIKWVRIRIVVHLLGFPTNQSGQRISLILWNWTDSKTNWNPFVKWIPRIKVGENNVCMLSIF